jgi:hypothetical protein
MQTSYRICDNSQILTILELRDHISKGGNSRLLAQVNPTQGKETMKKVLLSATLTAISCLLITADSAFAKKQD